MGPDSSNSLSSPAARPRSSRHGRAGITAAALIALVGMMGILDSAAAGAPQIGQPAPDFTAMDSKGGNMQSVQGLAQINGVT